MMTPDISDEENALEDVTINRVEDAEVSVVRPDDVTLMAPGHGGGQAIIAAMSRLTLNSGRVSEADKLLLGLSLNLRRSPELDSEQFAHFGESAGSSLTHITSLAGEAETQPQCVTLANHLGL